MRKDHASGLETRQHQGDSGWQSEGAGFWTGESDRERANRHSAIELADAAEHDGDECGSDPRNGRLHGAGTGEREDGGQEGRHLGLRSSMKC